MVAARVLTEGSTPVLGLAHDPEPGARLREVYAWFCSHNELCPLTDATESAGLAALADRIELWPIDQLRPYERNPRTRSEAQVDQIAASMVEFGWTNPILIDENAGILVGHGRLLAARKLGLAEAPVIRFEHSVKLRKRLTWRGRLSAGPGTCRR